MGAAPMAHQTTLRTAMRLSSAKPASHATCSHEMTRPRYSISASTTATETKKKSPVGVSSVGACHSVTSAAMSGFVESSTT